MATIAAFKTVENSGLTPQVKQGGMGNAVLDASKFDGTGLLNEQIVHVQLPEYVGAATRGTGDGLNGLPVLVVGSDELCVLCNDEGDDRRTRSTPRFTGFGWTMILAEERRKPA